MPWIYNGRTIREGRSWVNDQGTTHPSNWGTWSEQKKIDEGLVFEAPPAPYDPNFYWDADTPKTLDQVSDLLISRIASDRYSKEGAGVIWVDSANDKTYYLDTTIESQNRFASVRIAIESGERVDDGVWKCAEINGEEAVLTFRPTSNAELIEWSGLVHAHVQKCFEVESACVQKIMNAENVEIARLVSFEEEFKAKT